MARILFLTTAHQYDDDRIFHHQAKELHKSGHEVKICSLSSDFKGILNGIEIESYPVLHLDTDAKIKVFRKVIEKFQPDCILCSEPLAVVASQKKSKKYSIIYDITEWYPAKRMVQRFPFPLNVFHAIRFFLIQLYAGFLSTHFIFGEGTKKFPLAYVFPFKKRLILPYYPDDTYIRKSIKKLTPNEIHLAYTGSFSKEKGIENFFTVVDKLKKRNPQLTVKISLVGTPPKTDEPYFSDLLSQYSWEHITIKKPVVFEQFTETYAEADICFDLREINLENHHCLPIKIFYYAASGKPVIYTDLKATRQHVEVSKFGHLVNPEDAEAIAKIIENYLQNPELYSQHAQNARLEYEKYYNWDLIRKNFVQFIENAL